MALSTVDLFERNPPLDVEWAGFRTTSEVLGRFGWKMAIQNEFHGRPMETIQVMFHHPEIGLTIYGRSESSIAEPAYRPHFGSHRILVRLNGAISAKNDVRVVHADIPNVHQMRWVETAPCMVAMREGFFHGAPLFMDLAKPAAEELIVDPADVGRILDLVHKAQSPEQAAIRERNRRRERDSKPMTLHAHILSLAA